LSILLASSIVHLLFPPELAVVWAELCAVSLTLSGTVHTLTVNCLCDSSLDEPLLKDDQDLP
jgi:hypothetical protein